MDLMARKQQVAKNSDQKIDVHIKDGYQINLYA